MATQRLLQMTLLLFGVTAPKFVYILPANLRFIQDFRTSKHEKCFDLDNYFVLT